jgi:6-pyruvoyltetrahydropterin/6-carboxytetrahydropterin synthase
MIVLSRKISFAAAHRYYQKSFSEEENERVFGRCYTPHGHGHNYVLEVSVQGEVDPQTGMVINLVDLDTILKEVVDPLDHHHLNFDVPAFVELVPTTENIAWHCFSEIKKRLPKGVTLHRARLYESDDLWADYYGP